MSDTRPNVIVIVSDTFRPDYLGVNGHPWCKTPELDAWVDRTITFDGAMTSSFPTIPMRTDWFTGTFGHPRYGWRNLDPAAITLPHVLRQAGYTTQLIADTTHLWRADFFRPFNYFHFRRGHESDTPFPRMNDPVQPVITDRRKTRVDLGNFGRPVLADMHAHVNFRQRYEDESHCALLADDVCRWIEDNHRGRPFFLWCDFFDVHEPWFPPAYLLHKYHPGYDGAPMAHPNYHSADVYEAEELKNMRARYASMCTLLSKSVGRVLRLIDDTGLLENTIVVFMSDHGMYLGERRRTGKSLIMANLFDCAPFYRELTSICWSMHVPAATGLKALPAGTRLKQVIQAPDLMPTVLELCGVAAPKDWTIEGASLVPLLTGQTKAPPREVSMTAWSIDTHHQGKMTKCRMPTVTDGQWTLVLNEPPDHAPPRLYHVADDPQQQRDVFHEHKEEARRLHAKMIEWLTAHDADGETLERLSAANAGVNG